MKIPVLNVEIDRIDIEELQDILKEVFCQNKKITIAKVNSEFLLRSIESKEFSDTLDKMDLKIADGSGVLWAAKYLTLSLTRIPILRPIQAYLQVIVTTLILLIHPKYFRYPLPERFPGVNALKLMLRVAENENAEVYFFGSEKRILLSSLIKIKEEFPNLRIVGWHDGYGFQDKEVVADINCKEPKLLIVALGSPKQEYWIRDHIDELKTVRVAVGEGGSLDFIAGVQKRAPIWMQKTGIEWLWRLFMNRNKTVTEKSRAKRIWRAVPVFMYTVAREKIKGAKIENI